MDWPILSAWSDPAVTDRSLLLRLASVNDNVAVGVCANPNLLADDVLGILGRVQLTVERATVVARRVLPHLDTAGQLEVAKAAAARSPRTLEVILKGCTDATLVAVNAALADGTIRRPNAVRTELDQRVLDLTSTAGREVSDELAAVVCDVVPDPGSRYRTWELAVVNSWQTRDLARMTTLLAAHRPDQHLIHGSAVLGVPGLADQWFKLGGKFRTAALHDTTITLPAVLDWLAVADPVTEQHALVAAAGNVAVPLPVLSALMARLSVLRWPADGSTPDPQVRAAVNDIGRAVDDRFQHLPWALTRPIADESDPDLLTKLIQAADLDEPAILFELLLNPHLGVEDRVALLTAAQTGVRLLAPIALKRVFQAGADLTQVDFDRASHLLGSLTRELRLPEPKKSITAQAARDKASREIASSAPARLYVLERLEQVVSWQGGVVHAWAPLLAASLPDADTWVELYERAEYAHGPIEAVMDDALAQYRANAAPRAMAALLGNALGDIDD